MVKRVLKNATPEKRAMINQFLKYPEDSAGSIMTAEFVDLRKTMTVGAAIRKIRSTGLNKETVYTCYVTSADRRLEGEVSVKDLLMTDDESGIESIMDANMISVVTTENQEETAKLFSKYGLLSIPVVDEENRLVGIVTVDDAVEVMEQEATEDFERMAAMTPSEKPYLKTSVWTLARHRILWLLVLMVSAMITGGVLQKYEAAFAALPLLVTFIPMLTDTGETLVLSERYAYHPRYGAFGDSDEGRAQGVLERASGGAVGGVGFIPGELRAASVDVSGQ